MRRWIAIRASAALAIAGSVATLLFSALMAAGLALTPPRDVGTLPPAVLKAAGIVVALLFAAGAIWGICSGVGVFRRRRWARLSMVIFAALLAFFGGTGVLAMLLLPFPAEASVDQRLADIVRLTIIGFYVLLAAVGAWWLVLFNRKAALEYFSETGRAEPNARPLSIRIIGWYLQSSAVLTALCAVLRIPGVLFGYVVTGWTAMLVYTIYTAVQLYLGGGLLRLENKARIWAIVYFCAAALNGLSMAISPAMTARMQQIAEKMQAFSRIQAPEYPSGWLLAIPCMVFMAVPIWFLVRQRAAFSNAIGQG